ncbi:MULTISPECIES: hypothetical protein [unclassified Halomonas]|uniref:hypothetical protein n=1 Tax=unclassified Halomonas TaxID=2609666 RepID=UPI0011430C20|nr:hypothetical protein [Halomonas sp. JB37]
MSRDSTAKEIFLAEEVSSATIADEMVVTIARDGNPLSRFRDDIWDYSATSTAMKTLNFKTKVESFLSGIGTNKFKHGNASCAIKFLKTFAIHWINFVGGCSMSKLNGDLVAMASLICYCADNNIPVNKVFSTPNSIDFLISRGSSDKQVGILLAKIQRFTDTATALGNSWFWEELTPSLEFLYRLKIFRKQFPETGDTFQTLLIPSKIYQCLLKSTIEDLDRFIDKIDAINFIFQMRTLARDKAVSLDRKLEASPLTSKQAARVTFQWNKLILENDRLRVALKELLDAGISKNESWAGIVENFGRWQIRCAIVIAAFTGMRKGELLSIPLNGLKTLSIDNGDIPVVWSSTTKLEDNGVPRFTKWVTSGVVESAFEVARTIANGALSWTDDRSLEYPNEQDIPLFLSVEHGKKGKPHPRFRYAATSFNGGSAFGGLYKDELQISDQDVEEVSWFLYGEDLPNCISVGETWPLTFHQFRRSMAVYAAASGRVSYPVLKAQLKHISMVMTAYYSNSSSRAINILGNGLEVKALRAEWAEAKARAEADDLFHLLENGLPLAGSAGKKLRTQQTKGQLPSFLESRKTTTQAVKNGKIRYRPTLVGGCMSLKPCNKGAGVLASACISCENSVFLPGSKIALEQTKEFYKLELAGVIPKRARQEYEENVRQIDIFLQNLVESVEVS